MMRKAASMSWPDRFAYVYKGADFMRGTVRTLLVLLLLSLPAAAQFTNVTGTVTDPNGVPYGNGTIAPMLVNNSGQSVTLNGQPYAPPIQATGLDSTGKFSLNLPANANLSPAGTQWNFWVCSAVGTVNPSIGTGSQCFTLSSPLTIAGATQDISTQLQAAALALTKSGGTASSVPFSGVTAGANTKTLQMGAGGSFSVLNTGQNAGNQVWLPAGLSAPTTSCSNTGGTINSGQSIQVAYTLNSALGQTLSSVWVTSGVTTGCSGGTVSITINAPTLPTGYTGWTAYYCNGSGSPSCTVPVQVAACVNITGNCVITSSTNGTVALPTINTSILQPPNIQAFNGQPGEQPFAFFQKADGNYYPWLATEWASCDATAGPPLPCGTPTFTHRTWFVDLPNNSVQYGTPVAYKNSFIAMDHRYGVGTVNTNQDRALSIFSENYPSNDTSTYRGLFGIQQELDINGAPVVTGGIDANVIGAQYQISAVMTATPAEPANVIVQNNSFFNAGTGYLLGSGNVAVGVNSSMTNNTSTNAPAGTSWSPFRAQWGTGTGVGTNLFGQGYECDMPITAKKFSGGNYCFYIPNKALTLGNIDLALENEWQTSPGLTWSLIGPTVLDSISHDQVGTMAVNASTNVIGSITASPISLATAGISSVPCSGGTSTYTYQLVFVDANGGQSPAGATINAVNCTNPLTAGNPVTINIAPGLQRNDGNSTSHAFQQATRIDVYRVGGPMATGKIGSLTCAFNIGTYGCTAFSDTGLSASGSVPTLNSTGSVGSQFVSNTNGGTVNKIAGTCTAAAATTCTVTFTNPYVSAPICTATDATNVVAVKVTPSATSLVITTAASSSDVFDYICVGNPD